MRPRVFVCSPYRNADAHIRAWNVAMAEKICNGLSREGFAVFASHLFYTRFLNDELEAERAAGIESGLRFLQACDFLVAYANTPSAGMRAEITAAERLDIPVIRSGKDETVQAFIWRSASDMRRRLGG